MCLQPCRFGSAESNSISSSRRTGACISAVHSLIEPLPEEIGSESSPKLIYPLKKCQEIYMTNERLQRKLLQTSSTSDQDGSAPRPTSAWEAAHEHPQGARVPCSQGMRRVQKPRRGNSGHESCWDRGEVRSDGCSSAAAVKPLSSLLPAGRRGAGGSELPAAPYAGVCSRGCATGAARSISGEAQRGRAVAVGQQQAMPCRVLPPSRGRWRLPGFWLGRAAEPGRRCRSSLRFNRAAAAPR